MNHSGRISGGRRASKSRGDIPFLSPVIEADGEGTRTGPIIHLNRKIGRSVGPTFITAGNSVELKTRRLLPKVRERAISSGEFSGLFY